MKICYWGNGQACFLNCLDKILLKIISNLFQGFEVVDSYNNDNLDDNMLQITYLGDGKYHICHGVFNEVWPIEQALGYAVKTILEVLGQESNNIYFLHGGCVQYNGKNNCFLGRTKSGKSTLTYSLCQVPNCRYITDDLICVDDSLKCIPFIKPIFLRERKYIDEREDVTVIQYQNEYRYCVLPEFRVNKNELFNIDNIFIVERNPIKDFSAEKLSISSGFVNIWKNMHTSDFIFDKRNVALKLAKSTNIFKLNYRDVSSDLMLLLDYIK